MRFVETTDGFQLCRDRFPTARPRRHVRHAATRPAAVSGRRFAARRRDLLIEARDDATKLVAADPGLHSADHAKLRRMVLSRYGQALDLGDVG